MGWAWSTGTLDDVTSAVKRTWGSQGTVGKQQGGSPDASPGNSIGSFELDMSEGAGFWSFVPIQDSGAGAGGGVIGGGAGAVPGGAGGEFLTGPQHWQAQFEKDQGISTASETPYAQYRRGLGSQFILPYALQAYEEEALGAPRTPYTDYLSGIDPQTALPGGGAFRDLRGMTPEEQGMFFAEMGIPEATGQRAAFRGALRERGTLPWMARIMSQRAFRDAPQRAWAATPAAGLEEETYLDALARKYALAG